MRTRPLTKKHERRMLVVEDSQKVGALLGDFLRFWFPEYLVELADTGEMAVQIVGSKKQRVILMDIGLPGINGIEAARRIRRLDPTAAIIIVTIHDSPEYQAEAMKAGADAFILKDRMYAELVPAIRELLGSERDAGKGDLSST